MVWLFSRRRSTNPLWRNGLRRGLVHLATYMRGHALDATAQSSALERWTIMNACLKHGANVVMSISHTLLSISIPSSEDIDLFHDNNISAQRASA